MASKLLQMKSKACEASKFVSKHGTTYCKQFLEKNRQYIQEPDTVEKCQELSKQLPYTRLARSFFLTLLSDYGFGLMCLLDFNCVACVSIVFNSFLLAVNIKAFLFLYVVCSIG